MSDSLKRWSSQLDNESKRSALHHAMDRGAVGLLNAREDVRQKLVDEAWFERDTVSNDASYGVSGPSQHAGTVWEHEGDASHSEGGTIHDGADQSAMTAKRATPEEPEKEADNEITP